MEQINTNNERDPKLWKEAKKRAGFKGHAFWYVVINLFMWAVWFFTKDNGDVDVEYPWPIWTTIGWGIGLASHYASAYKPFGMYSPEKEYEKLKRDKK